MSTIRKPVIAVMTIGDPREHEWNNVFKDIAYDRHAKMIGLLEKLPVELVYEEELPRSVRAIQGLAQRLKARGAQVLLLHIACWTWPNLAHGAVRQPGNGNPCHSGTVGRRGRAESVRHPAHPGGGQLRQRYRHGQAGKHGIAHRPGRRRR